MAGQAGLRPRAKRLIMAAQELRHELNSTYFLVTSNEDGYGK